MTYPPQPEDQQPGGQQPGGQPSGPDGAPPAPQYGAPQTPQYGAPQNPQYGAPQAPQYGAPHGGGGYGAPQPGYGHQPMHQGTNTLSIVGLITAFLIWPVGLVLSIIGLRQTKRTGEKGRGLAIGGIVVSALGAIGSIILVIFTIAVAGDAISEAERERELSERVVQNDGFAVAPTDDPVERLEDQLADEDFGLGLDDLDEDIAELEEALGNLGYAEGADAATCDAIWGTDDDAVMNLFFDAALITDPDEALEFVETTTARVDEVAAEAPEEIRADLETLSEMLATSVTVEGLSEAETIQSETERATTAIGEYCFGG